MLVEECNKGRLPDDLTDQVCGHGDKDNRNDHKKCEHSQKTTKRPDAAANQAVIFAQHRKRRCVIICINQQRDDDAGDQVNSKEGKNIDNDIGNRITDIF